MCQPLLAGSSLWALLLRLDEDLAAEARQRGCGFCGGKLERADYPRKPRGLPRALAAAYARRRSFCCAREGCRRRHTPASVRFLGRRVFLGAVVVLAAALAQGVSARRRAQLCRWFGVDARTLRRWQRWWREEFVAGALWRELRGRFRERVEAQDLPAALLDRCSGADEFDRLVQLLKLLSPLSTTHCSRERI